MLATKGSPLLALIFILVCTAFVYVSAVNLKRLKDGKEIKYLKLSTFKNPGPARFKNYWNFIGGIVGILVGLYLLIQ